MLKFKNNSMFLHIFLVGLVIPATQLTAMSLEEKNAKIAAGQALREERAALKQLGDFRDVIYNQDAFGKQTKKIVAFRAYGLGVRIYSDNTYFELVKNKPVLFERGKDLYGNESYTNACMSADCSDIACKTKSFIPVGMLTKMAKKSK